MLLYAPDLFLMKPGLLLVGFGLLITASLITGPWQLFGIGLDLHTMLLGITMTTLGYSAVQFATLARSFYDFDPGWRRRLARRLTFERGMRAVDGIAYSLNSWLELDEDVRESARRRLAQTARDRFGWEQVADGVIAAAQGKLGLLEPPVDILRA